MQEGGVIAHVLGGWGGWTHPKHTESLSQASPPVFCCFFLTSGLSMYGKNHVRISCYTRKILLSKYQQGRIPRLQPLQYFSPERSLPSCCLSNIQKPIGCGNALRSETIENIVKEPYCCTMICERHYFTEKCYLQISHFITIKPSTQSTATEIWRTR